MENSYLLTYLLFTPVAGAIILLFFNKEKENAVRWFGLIVSVIAFIISLVIYFNFDISKSGFQFIHQFKWIEKLNISYKVGNRRTRNAFTASYDIPYPSDVIIQLVKY